MDDPQMAFGEFDPKAQWRGATGDLDGNVLGLDAATWKLLWKSPTANAIGGGVITYSVGGKQYIAAAAGMKSPIWPVPSQSSRVVVLALP